MKKIISFIMCLTLLLPLPVYAEQSAEKRVYYTADFDDGTIPSGSEFTRGEDGELSAEDGKMRFKASDTYPPVSTVLFPYEVRYDEYFYGCDVTVLSSLSGNCWFSLCFGAVNDDILYQFTVKCDASANDSVSLQCKNGASSWKKTSAAKLSDFIGDGGIDPDKFSDGMIKDGAGFRLAVAVKDGMAFGFIDGVAVVEGGLPAKRYGKTGLNGRGVTVIADNVEISSDIPARASAADRFSADLYIPDTGIAAPPVVVQRDRLNLPVYTAGSQRPSAVMMNVKESDGSLHGYDGTSDLGELKERTERFADLALPAFYVSDAKSASALSGFIEENGKSDCFVVVSNAALLEYFSGNVYTRTVMDMSSRDSVSSAEICGLLYSNGCRSVMLSESAADGDTVYELHKRLITVWVSGTSGVDSLFDSAVNGADAIVTSESAELLSVFEEIKETSVVRRSVVIYDGRGDTAVTADAVRSVLSKGVSAVRLGVVCTDGGETVVGSDGTGASSGAALEELLRAVYRELPGSVFHLDIKDGKTFAAASALIKEYDMKDRCVILSRDASVIKEAISEGMPAAYSGGPETVDGRDVRASLSSLCRTLNELNSAYYAGVDDMPDELASLMRSRGMFVCIDTGDGGAVPVTSGCGGFTVKSLTKTEKIASGLTASADKSGRLSAKVKYNDKTELDVTVLCNIVTLSGEAELSDGIIRGSGTFAVICPQTSDEGEKYCVFSNTIRISEEAEETETEPAEEKKDGNGIITVIIIAVSSVIAVAGVIILLLINGKKRKNAKKEAE